ncbi:MULTISPECIES: 6-hydroxymethylpterin diphosphokinase MptE-like protein [Gammaproteobacteria]|uniref:6-hydroxymethylpterin diphosphokinase MptE-like protein n=1 Tax=Gammaproteobacteria TaxID=1236 RepID=UPI000DD04A90|nr:MULTISPECIES: 6-hydroxymethylpterin diphosphokinase MptE-like protein [Gammaproteobacteria]RTE86144.1 DUF115 domain-containing protein [Aliidiomarina sp. B3213]TCZ91497.1 DUF115 domain-containing protein [Lysobacter sp. N42]
MQFRDFRHQIEPDEQKLTEGLEAAKHRFEDNLALLQLQQPELVKQLKSYALKHDTLCIDRAGDVQLLLSQSMTFAWPPREYEASYVQICNKLSESKASLLAISLQHSGANVLSLIATNHAPVILVYVSSLSELYVSLHAHDWRKAFTGSQLIFQIGGTIEQVEQDLETLEQHGLSVKPCTVIQTLSSDEESEAIWHFEQALNWTYDCDPSLRVHTHKFKDLCEFELLNTLIDNLRHSSIAYEQPWTLILVGASASILKHAIHKRNLTRIVLVHPHQSFAEDAIQKANELGIEILSINGSESELPGKLFLALNSLSKAQHSSLRIYQGDPSSALEQLRQLCELELRYLVQPTTGVQRLYQSALHTTQIEQNVLTRRSRWPESGNGKVPALILGNGPSLKKIIPELRKGAFAGYLIVSCGTAISTLAQENITPHLHLELEYFAGHLSSLPEAFYSETTFVGPLGFNHRLRSLFQRQRSFVIDGHPFDEVVPHIPDDAIRVTEAFPTVANLAAELMPKLGADSVFLAGIDLAFKGSEHHAGGEMYEQTSFEQYKHSSGGAIEAVNVDGQLVHTKREFIFSAQQLKKIIQQSPTAQYFSISEGLPLGAEVLKQIPANRALFDAEITPVSRCTIQWSQLGYNCDSTAYFDELKDICLMQPELAQQHLYRLLEDSDTQILSSNHSKNIGRFWSASLIASLASLMLRHIEKNERLPDSLEDKLKNLAHLVLLYSAKI